jgi:hypothetical protein
MRRHRRGPNRPLPSSFLSPRPPASEQYISTRGANRTADASHADRRAVSPTQNLLRRTTRDCYRPCLASTHLPAQITHQLLTFPISARSCHSDLLMILQPVSASVTIGTPPSDPVRAPTCACLAHQSSANICFITMHRVIRSASCLSSFSLQCAVLDHSSVFYLYSHD